MSAMTDEITLRLSDYQDGYEILLNGEVLRFIPMREVLLAKNPDRLIHHAVYGVQKRVRVRRFVRNLKNQ